MNWTLLAGFEALAAGVYILITGYVPRKLRENDEEWREHLAWSKANRPEWWWYLGGGPGAQGMERLTRRFPWLFFPGAPVLIVVGIALIAAS